ncbi:MAG: hypothetical protein WC648_01215 [Candidatus Paceibacterota bacterium]|jgi:hypothetical protein
MSNEKRKVQSMRISDAEFELLKSTFSEREELLKTIRNLFFGLPITDDEKKQIRETFSGEALRKLMRKQFLPELQNDLPIGQAIDLWMTIDLKDKAPEQARYIVIARKLLIEMVEQSLKLLENPDLVPVDLTEWQIKEEAPDLVGTSLIARNTFISHTDQQLAVIRTLAGQKLETVEETKKRLLQDSSK